MKASVFHNLSMNFPLLFHPRGWRNAKVQVMLLVYIVTWDHLWKKLWFYKDSNIKRF